MIGFIGIGIMGSGMAANLVGAGHDVVVWNRTRSKAEAVEGASVAETPRELFERCDIIMVCVSDTPDVVDLFEGGHGLLDAVRPGQLIVDHSTISPSETIRLGTMVAERDAAWIDAPVSGGSEGAARGTLSIMIGGDAGAVERARPYLEAFGTTITHVGGLGDGQTVKLVNQILVVVNQLAVSEALVFAEAAGLDLPRTLDAVSGGAAGSWMLSNRGPQMIADDWRPGFTIDLQQKDLRLVLERADQLGVPVIATALVYQLYRTLQQQGLGAEGNHALVKALHRMTGRVE
ncbi:MAG: NAD(P)-dependent oxidoreductase [Acidimicrobiia bacterium]|nr:NAD(P)-dependent oxidoreductase [Acidimicrobiia bacterium]